MTVTHFRARPTVYKGIKMRSRLEALWAVWMDETGCEWTYEPQCFASERGQYLPDFGLRDWNGDTNYIEVKPFLASPEALEALQQRMEIIWESEPDAWLMINVGQPDREDRQFWTANPNEREWYHTSP